MYNYMNDFSKFLEEQKLATLQAPEGMGRWELIYIGPKEIEATIVGMNEYLGEWVDGQELFSKSLPEQYNRWMEIMNIFIKNEPMAIPDIEKLEEEQQKIGEMFWQITYDNFTDLILFIVASRKV